MISRCQWWWPRARTIVTGWRGGRNSCTCIRQPAPRGGPPVGLRRHRASSVSTQDHQKSRPSRAPSSEVPAPLANLVSVFAILMTEDMDQLLALIHSLPVSGFRSLVPSSSYATEADGVPAVRGNPFQSICVGTGNDRLTPDSEWMQEGDDLHLTPGVTTTSRKQQLQSLSDEENSPKNIIK